MYQVNWLGLMHVCGCMHALLLSIGKTPVVCTDSPGFIVNRLLILNSLAKACDDISYKPADILLNYVKNGKLGVKSKEGFFNYQ